MCPVPATDAIVAPARRIRGRVSVPGDKSISHRYAILAALAEGVTEIAGFASGADCASTLACLEAAGAGVGWRDSSGRRTLLVEGRGLRGLRRPPGPLDAGNSGTTMRLLAGVLAAHPFEATLIGDASLSRRPMRRVAEPLVRMGAAVSTVDGHAPLTVRGGLLRAIEHVPDVPSAQVKSAVVIAGLQAEGTTRVRERAPTRDHTELAVEAFGGAVRRNGHAVEVTGGERLRARALEVPGDLSSAAYWAVAAAAIPGSRVEIAGVGLNPTRTAFLDVLFRSGARVEVAVEGDQAGEPRGSIVVEHGGFTDLRVDAGEVPALIDELPVLAALAVHGGSLTVTGAGELRAKESDRISALVAGLRVLGARADERPDGFHVECRGPITGGAPDACGDHRLAMSFAVAALGGLSPSIIRRAACVEISYPGFFGVLDALRA
jgi:3-phosphoshikimate 1-carboxyvinyltransferase